MAIRTCAGLVLAALLTTACDQVSQKKPETGPARVETRAHSGPDASAGERSIRLFGRGVSRQRQTRV